MGMVETVTWRDPWDVDRRLAELRLGPRARLLKVRSVAIAAGADATPFHPANAVGTFSYHHGTFALRNEFVGDDGGLIALMALRRSETTRFKSRSCSRMWM